MGPIRRNHAQIRGARTEPAERMIIERDQLEIEQEQERQPANPQQMELESTTSQIHTELESATPQAHECRLPFTKDSQTAIKVQRLCYVDSQTR